MTDEGKEKAIEYFKWWKSFNEHTQKAIPKDTIAYKAYETEIGYYDMAIKALEQEPKSEWEHDHEILKAYADGGNNVLDKVRDEILDNTFSVVNPNNTYEYINVIDLDSIDDILDKYKSETEQ